MNILVVGAGLAGATIARVLAEKDMFVKIIDKRSEVAGNVADYINAHGIRVHKYGPHLFHTNDVEVYSWLSQFATWIDYKHRVKALLSDGRFATLPVNQETKNMVGENNVLDIFYRPYTKKMWGMTLDELSPSIIQRVPIRDDDNEFYFPNDKIQALPIEGYSEMVRCMLDHPKITLLLNTPYDETYRNQKFDHVFNSMPIDEYYNFSYGRLPYRSIKIHNVDVPKSVVCMSEAATVNFTDAGPYTRVTEWCKLPAHGCNKYITTLTYEEPCNYIDNNMERFYPVKDVKGVNNSIYQQYLSIPNSNMTFIGRCGTYQYLDMWQAVRQSLDISRGFENAKH